jgi:2-polyprenyl-6-methoxyphenol hydroxylase-like FAD-dependent oxidoreductase
MAFPAQSTKKTSPEETASKATELSPPITITTNAQSLRNFGTAALKSCLPEDLYTLIADTAAISNRSPQISLLTEKLDVLLQLGLLAPGNADIFAVSRIVLHRILSMQLDDTVHYDHRYDHTETLPSGRLRVHFTNGVVAEGDLLVAADGIHSTIRREFLPHSFEPVKVGTVGVVGKVFCDEASASEGDDVDRGVAVIFGTGGRGAFIGPQRYSADAKVNIYELFAGMEGVPFEEQLSPNATGEELRLLGVEQKTALIDDARDYILFAYITSHPDELGFESEESRFGVSQQGLLDAVLRETKERKWSPKLIDLVSKMDINSIGYWPLHISPNVPTLKGHKPANVTFLGDSIHASTSPPKSFD